MTDYGGSDPYIQELVQQIRELTDEIDRLKGGLCVTDEVNESLVKENKKLKAALLKHRNEKAK